jgi:phosphatidylserine synthase
METTGYKRSVPLAPACALTVASVVLVAWPGIVTKAVFCIALGILATAVFAPVAYARFDKLQRVVTHAILRLLSWIVLALVFIAVFLPAKLVVTLTRLKRKSGAPHPGTWVELPPGGEESCRHPY